MTSEKAYNSFNTLWVYHIFSPIISILIQGLQTTPPLSIARFKFDTVNIFLLGLLMKLYTELCGTSFKQRIARTKLQ